MGIAQFRGLGGCLSALVAAALAAACSGGSDDSSGKPCNSLVNDGPTVSMTLEQAIAPLPGGGQLADGTYVLSAFTLYAPSGAGAQPDTKASAVIVVQGSTMQQAGTIDGEDKTYTTTYTTSGTTITTNDTCPKAQTESHNYTATPAEIDIYDAINGLGTIVQTYARR